MRNLLLEARGWTVISIPVVDSVGLEQRGKRACLEYLEQALFSRSGTSGKQQRGSSEEASGGEAEGT